MASNLEQFLGMRTRSDIAAFLEISNQQLGFLAFSGVSKYLTFTIDKKQQGEQRVIKAPIAVLKNVQRKLAENISEVYESSNPPEAVHGFRSNRSIATNAICHVRRAVVLNVDLEDFFPSISGGRIHGLFKAEPFGFPEEVANALTNLVCDDGSLPQGAPTSPVLSNCICKRMDKQLLSFARKNNLVYTRYADDLTFSSFNKRQIRRTCLADDSPDLVLSAELVEIITKNGFAINSEKTRLSTRSSRQEVTGVVVNEKCNFKRSEYRELRVLLHNWIDVGWQYAGEMYLAHKPEIALAITDEADQISKEKLKRHVRGRLAFYTMLVNENSRQSQSLRKLWTMYHEATGERVPMVNPESAVWQIVTSYDYVSAKDGENKLFAAVGTAFKTSDNRIITAAHCIIDLNNGETSSDACCEIDGGRVKQPCAIADFNWDTKYDYAVLSKIPLGLKNVNGLSCDNSYRAQVGETVWAYGYSDAKVQLRCLEAQVVEVYDDGKLYRVNRPFIEGMSGGPVINSRGDVIGVILRGSAPHEYTYDGEYLCIGKALGEATESVVSR